MTIQSLLAGLQTALPVTVAAAIIIFVTKEVLEFFRRRGERSRKLGAVKSLLAEELEKNHWALTSMFRILKEIDEYSDTFPAAEYSLVVARNGAEHYRVRPEPDDASEHGMAIPKFHEEQYKKLLPSLAELAPKIFKSVNVAYTELAELAHYRETLIDFLADDEWFAERQICQSFLRHLAGDRDRYFEPMDKAYRLLSGTPLKALRLR